MSNVNVYLKEKISAVSSNVFVAPEIPTKKLNNAAESMKLVDSINAIIAIYDNTLFGSAKDGFAVTGEKIVVKNAFDAPFSMSFTEIETVKYVRNVSVSDKGKEKVEECIDFIKKDGNTVKLSGLLDCNYEKLAEVLNSAVQDFDSFEEEDQLITLSEMSERLKVAYVQIVINMAFSDDGVIDHKEYAEILQLMTRLELSKDSRFELRGYLASIENLFSIENLLGIIDAESKASHNKSIKISLVKDIINVHMSVNNGEYLDCPFLKENQKLFGVTDEEIELAIQAIKLDFSMLKDDFTDDALKRGIKELGAKAGAVGVPLAAVYLSGSVVGLSAAGLTSGLATLGLGGALGFSSMATGIGVAVLIGVGAYKGIRHLTGANELDKAKRRELMLNEIIKQTQRTISYLIEDLNIITAKLNEALQNFSVQDAKVVKLMQMISALNGAAGVLNAKSNATNNSYIKLSCPKELDLSKLKSLTSEPTKQQLYNLVMSFYEVKNITKLVDGSEKSIDVYVLKQDITTEQLDRLAKIFDAIGYFKVADVLKSKVAGLFS
ncbi:conserved hypothetical protein [Shewanella sp. MR-4]|uniref:hypothetical protein n=1 Tax=Shewanella sp. (strain MR-4) TaxID=60480 RepID=UPI00005E51D9|nr:hypothetical protein [Shewanella sp. MR-4]ABI40275.1 conserved hypothetical protein [Shewanella sp. MR-4]